MPAARAGPPGPHGATNMPDILRDIIRRNRAGQPVAIVSVCTAHPQVLLACLKRAAELGEPLG